MADLPVDRPLRARTAPGKPTTLRAWLKSWRGSSRLRAWGAEPATLQQPAPLWAMWLRGENAYDGPTGTGKGRGKG